jgi:hypothetical protein
MIQELFCTESLDLVLSKVILKLIDFLKMSVPSMERQTTKVSLSISNILDLWLSFQTIVSFRLVLLIYFHLAFLRFTVVETWVALLVFVFTVRQQTFPHNGLNLIFHQNFVQLLCLLTSVVNSMTCFLLFAIAVFASRTTRKLQKQI